MKISIITVTLNSDQTIRDTLNSVFSQTYKNIEHIIVDGGSNDQTLSILKRYPNKKSFPQCNNCHRCCRWTDKWNTPYTCTSKRG